MEWHTFPEGEEPEVFTSVSQEWPANAPDVPASFSQTRRATKPVFCVHWCTESRRARTHELPGYSGPLFPSRPFRLLFPRRLAL